MRVSLMLLFCFLLIHLFATDGQFQPQWSYMDALERGWIPKGNLNSPQIRNACVREESGSSYKCILKRGQIDQSIKGAAAYVLNAQNLTDSQEAKQILSLSGDKLHDAAEKVLSDYFDEYRLEGATCDFGGIALLIERNVTLTAEDMQGFDSDFYHVYNNGEQGPVWWILALAAIAIALIAGLCGFIVAMRYNGQFNRFVRESTVFRPITKSRSKVIRSSLNLPDLGNYEELSKLIGDRDAKNTI